MISRDKRGLRFGFRFFRWWVHLCVTPRGDAYAQLQNIIEDALIHGESFTRISHDEVFK